METIRNPWGALFLLLISVFILLEAAIFQVPALPYITEYFGVDMGFAGSMSVAYYAAAVVFAPLMGRFSDQYGRKQMILIGLTIFTLSEYMAALSPNFAVLLTARFIQGLGYACVFPVVIAFISDTFDENNRGKALGYFSAVGGIGGASGGIIAGLLISGYGWSSIYWVSAILSTMGLILAYFFMPKTPAKSAKQKLDIFGAITLLLTIGSLMTLPMIITNFGIASTISLILITTSLLGLTLTIYAEFKAIHPILDLKVLRLRSLYLPAVIIVCLQLFTISLTYVLTFYIAGREGWGPAYTGLISTINYSALTISTAIVGYFVDKYPPRNLVVIGVLVGGLAVTFYSLITSNSPYAYLVFIVILIGICNGFLHTSLLKIVTTGLPNNLRGNGSGTYMMFRDLGVPFGSAGGLALYSLFISRSTASNELQATTDAINNIGYIGFAWIVLMLGFSALLFFRNNKSLQVTELKSKIS